MATNSSIEIDGINIYSHYDGYEKGMAIKLLNAIKKLHKEKYRTTKFINAFISANLNNCELDIREKIGGTDYKYIIEKNNITIYKTNLETETKYCSDITTVDKFINNQLKEKVITIIDEQPYTKKQVKQKYKYYKKEAIKFDKKNPNRKKYLEKMNIFFNKLITEF